ncbi:uncharacterized protein EDB91DRAFT_53157 [Suillus paluster]|uniref:uncharacterized protein n=1 Tax=Suillus paluster TaxID=48578 RepID=UPI001B872B6E|nr:uncharacterized protein EDB91DRAFT_53157 [Suillus paluster]KAG1747994.1 hypothetical protein EDB91DRAFT_53157 [Suillus paluster]
MSDYDYQQQRGQWPEFASEYPPPTSYLAPTNVTSSGARATFRALPLLPDDLVTTRVTVSHSSVKPNDRGKEVLSFVIIVDPGSDKDPWKVEKLYSDVLSFDNRMRASVGKGVGKKMAVLPEGKIWRDHAPAKSDQRKAALEVYLQSLVDLPVKNKDEIIAFFTSNIIRETDKPVMQVGYKEGYLTKRGKNFGGWKSRYFVLDGPVLRYYECRGGAHLGSIVITSAQIGQPQRDSDNEGIYRHAFLIIEANKAPKVSHSRHVLCAESDSERDNWVDILVRYVSGTFEGDPVASISVSPSSIPINVDVPPGQGLGSGQPKSDTSSDQDGPSFTPIEKRSMWAMSKDDISRGPTVPISQLTQDGTNAKLFHSTPIPVDTEDPNPPSASSTKGIDPSAHNERDYYTAEETARRILERGQRSGSSEQLSNSLPSLPLVGASGNMPVDKSITHVPRAIFGIPLEESIEVAEIARLPAVVFRCIQYLEAKKADQEEGIYRFSGSLAVIKGLKDRFNAKGDMDLLASDRYWNPHAIAGLLKCFLRELPTSILTRELRPKFLAVIDLIDAQERIRELSDLVSSLPIANYSLLLALTAHLILIVQNSTVNKMSMSNVGIVFSPVLGIPANVLSLMLGEFNRVFSVDAGQGNADNDGEPKPRNSRQHSDAAADQLLDLPESLNAPFEETSSEDGGRIFLHYERGNAQSESSRQTRTGSNLSLDLATLSVTPATDLSAVDLPFRQHHQSSSITLRPVSPSLLSMQPQVQSLW